VVNEEAMRAWILYADSAKEIRKALYVTIRERQAERDWYAKHKPNMGNAHLIDEDAMRA
jgi:hypothetical protein